jgi:hypothetical protein
MTMLAGFAGVEELAWLDDELELQAVSANTAAPTMATVAVLCRLRRNLRSLEAPVQLDFSFLNMLINPYLLLCGFVTGQEMPVHPASSASSWERHALPRPGCGFQRFPR